MIKTFRDKGLKLFAETGNPRKLSVQNPKRIQLILNTLNAATKVSDMDAPGFRLHPIPRIEKGAWAVDVSGNWRITFKFEGEDAIDVDLRDYH